MAFRLDKIDSLFPTPLLHFTVDDADALNAGLMAEIAARRIAEQGVTRTNCGGWHSHSDLFGRTEPAQAKLAATIKQAMVAAMRKLAPGAPLDTLQLVCEGWINVNPTGAYNAPHDHGGAFWSGVYYVSVPPEGSNPPAGEGGRNSGVIEFIAAQHLTSPGARIQAPMTAGKARFRPPAGTLLMFPATLTHWVHPNLSAEERVTVAFNGWVTALNPADGAQPRS